MFAAQSSGHPSTDGTGAADGMRPVTADEIWDFCAYGIICG